MEVVGSIIVFIILFTVFFLLISFIVRIVAALVSKKDWNDIERRKRFYFFWFLAGPIGFLIMVATLFNGAYVGMKPPSKEMRTRNLEEQIQVAAINYRDEYDVLPTVANNASFINALEGANPRGIAFLTITTRDQNAKGEALDAWGTPLCIVVQNGSVIVQSAGPDRTWGTADDMDNSRMPSP